MTSLSLRTMFRSKPLLDTGSAQWIYDTFTWAQTHFDNNEFLQRSILIQPSNEFFPGKVDSIHAMAENIFQHTLRYAGLQHWPFKLQAPEQFNGLPPPQIELAEGALARNSSNTENLPRLATQTELYLSYQPQQTAKPEDLSSTFAHLIAQHLVAQTQKMPPGDKDLFFASTEVLAIFMGFGVMFANSAFTYKGGCGSCYNAMANRQSSLSEDEAIFALALFCHLKDIPNKEATRYLKSHLKSSYKKAATQIGNDRIDK